MQLTLRRERFRQHQAISRLARLMRNRWAANVDCRHFRNPQTGLSNYCILFAEYRRLPV